MGVISSLLFLLYGSLVPLDFEYKPLEQAWSEFVGIMSRGLYVRSRVDMGENFLLMIPVGFCGLGLIWPDRHRVLVLPFAAVVCTCCFCVSFLIEFLQTFFIGRTPAFSDVLMQTLGSLAGVFAWWLWGVTIWVRFFQDSHSGKPFGIFEKLLWIYVIVVLLYNIIPLDLTINPFLIYNKYKAGRIVLIPFTYNYGQLSAFVYGVITDVIVWIPAGFLWVLTKGKKPMDAWLWTLFAVTAIEITQLFISSRIFDVTDILLGTVGGGIGVLLCLNIPFLDAIIPKNQDRIKKNTQAWAGVVFFFIWCFFLAAVFWFPYEVLIERRFVESQLYKFFQVPFHVYYYSGGLTAITAVFQKSLFFAPLGVSLAIASQSFRKYGINSLLTLIALLCFTGVGLVIELGQALMPNKIPDSTDLLFEIIGGLSGYWVALKIYDKKKS